MIGYNYFNEDGFYWRKHQNTIIPLSMPHIEPNLSKEKAKKLLKTHKCYLIRWDNNFDSINSKEWWHIIKSEKESLSDLKPRVRNKIRKGAKTFQVKICDKKFIINQGYDVYLKAFERYDTFEKIYKKEEFAEAIKKLPSETEFWGVFDKINNELVAFSENIVKDNACFYLTIWLTPESMKKYSSYILFHEMNKYYLNEKNLQYVSDGARSISHQTGIHDFLISKFAFRKAYSTLNLVYAPWLGLIIKLSYPFRTILKKVNISVINKVSILLEQHRIFLETKESY